MSGISDILNKIKNNSDLNMKSGIVIYDENEKETGVIPLEKNISILDLPLKLELLKDIIPVIYGVNEQNIDQINWQTVNVGLILYRGEFLKIPPEIKNKIIFYTSTYRDFVIAKHNGINKFYGPYFQRKG